MRWKSLTIWLTAFSFTLAAALNRPKNVTELKVFPLDGLEGVIDSSAVRLDKTTSSDGGGSLRITAAGAATVRLLEVSNIHLDNVQIIYQARVRTRKVHGQVYLEMWCSFPGKGEFFSRNLHAPLSGTTDWTTVATPFFLKKGEKPDRVKLNLVITGRGTAWIDDIRILKAPLP